MGKRIGKYRYSYPRPMVTTDIVVLAGEGESQASGGLSVLLIRRGREPFAGAWALPGGYLEENEPPLKGAERELREETGLRGLELREIGSFGAPGRDPRGWTISLAFSACLETTSGLHPEAGDDAAALAWFPVTGLPALAFDHQEIIERALLFLQA